MKMNKKLILNLMMLTVLVLGGFGIWYNLTYSMKKADGYEVNQAEEEGKKILIATQGSKYKNRLTSALVAELKDENNFIKIIDVYDFSSINVEDWDVIVVLHTWEIWKPPVPVKDFISKIDNKTQLVVHTTSGDGEYKYPGVDAISGASEIKNVDKVKEKLLQKINSQPNET